MIIDHIRNRALYYGLGDDYKKTLDYMAASLDAKFEEGDINVPESNSVIKARLMHTKPEENCKLEAHKKFVDIHFVVYGREQIAYTDINKCKEISYDEAKDFALLDGTAQPILLDAGYFMITFTDDGHMPSICVDEPCDMGKMVTKIPV